MPAILLVDSSVVSEDEGEIHVIVQSMEISFFLYCLQPAKGNAQVTS